jgi:hypothetical protein
MKNAIYLFLVVTALLQAEEPVNEIPNTPVIELEEKPQAFFSYFSLGSCGFALPIGPEASVGWRKLNSRHVWDVHGGSSLVMGRYFWGQISYLYYFLPNTGTYSSPYCGVGLTVGHSRLRDYDPQLRNLKVYGNIPFTMGYQWGKNRTNQFFQIQFTPILITTLSYGVGF